MIGENGTQELFYFYAHVIANDIELLFFNDIELLKS